MASNGLEELAKKGKCRICYRVRETIIQVKAVGEVHHGYATGHIWECIDGKECENKAKEKIEKKAKDWELIKIALRRGRFKQYIWRS